jgi:quercetin dioxygenase-like cupin family protein
VLQGTLFFEIEGEISSIGPGDIIIIPSNKKHKVWTNEEAVKAVDAWSPTNDKYSKN